MMVWRGPWRRLLPLPPQFQLASASANKGQLDRGYYWGYL